MQGKHVPLEVDYEAPIASVADSEVAEQRDGNLVSSFNVICLNYLFCILEINSLANTHDLFVFLLDFNRQRKHRNQNQESMG